MLGAHLLNAGSLYWGASGGAWAPLFLEKNLCSCGYPLISGLPPWRVGLDPMASPIPLIGLLVLYSLYLYL